LASGEDRLLSVRLTRKKRAAISLLTCRRSFHITVVGMGKNLPVRGPAVAMVVTYYSDEQRRGAATFEILVDGQRVADQEVTRSSRGRRDRPVSTIIWLRDS
jgi:hypothetical protein